MKKQTLFNLTFVWPRFVLRTIDRLVRKATFGKVYTDLFNAASFREHMKWSMDLTKKYGK